MSIIDLHMHSFYSDDGGYEKVVLWESYIIRETQKD